MSRISVGSLRKFEIPVNSGKELAGSRYVSIGCIPFANDEDDLCQCEGFKGVGSVGLKSSEVVEKRGGGGGGAALKWVKLCEWQA